MMNPNTHIQGYEASCKIYQTLQDVVLDFKDLFHGKDMTKLDEYEVSEILRGHAKFYKVADAYNRPYCHYIVCYYDNEYYVVYRQEPRFEIVAITESREEVRKMLEYSSNLFVGKFDNHTWQPAAFTYNEACIDVSERKAAGVKESDYKVFIHGKAKLQKTNRRKK